MREKWGQTTFNCHLSALNKVSLYTEKPIGLPYGFETVEVTVEQILAQIAITATIRGVGMFYYKVRRLGHAVIIVLITNSCTHGA